MRAAHWIVIFVAAANQLAGADLEICVENPARLDALTAQAFRKELEGILAASARQVSFSCGPGAVRVTLLDQPPAEETAALGGTRIENGRLLPRIDLFVGPVSRLVDTRLPGILGRALARVALHELGHWLSQNQAHRSRGVMMERLSAAHLMAADRSFFRITLQPAAGANAQ